MTVRGVLGRHDFRQLWIGDAISRLGSTVSMLALPLVALNALEAGAGEVGLLTVFESLAYLLVGLPAGAWVDRLPRRAVLLAADLGRAALLGSVPAAWMLDVLTLAQLYGVALGVGILSIFHGAAYQSYVPTLVGKEQLVEANARLEASNAVANWAGPGAGGLLVQWLSAPFAVVLDALSFVASAAFIGRIRAREARTPVSTDRRLGREIREGLRFVVGHPVLRGITMSTAILSLFGSMSGSMVIVLLSTDVGLSAGSIGLVFGAAGAAGLAGAALAPKVTARLGQGPALVTAVAVSALLGLVTPTVREGWLVWCFAVSNSLGIACAVVYRIIQVSFRQRLCPPELRGRVNGTVRFLVWGMMPIGGAVGTGLGAACSPRTALWVAACGALTAVLPLLLAGLPRMRALPDDRNDRPAADAPEAAAA
ncbi:MFS transporter [Streptomyces globosus]